MIYTDLTIKALNIAYKAHEGQLDKSGIPYIFHPYHLAEQMKDEASTCVALLHDVIEDTDLSFEDLEAEFTPEIMEGVRLMTHDPQLDYLEYVRAICANPIAKAVKFADLAHNSDETRMIGCDATALENFELRRSKYEQARQILLESEKPTGKRYSMRRSKQSLTDKESYHILLRGREGVLSLADEHGVPYGVPMNYVLDGTTIYFHCARVGRKLDIVKKNPQAAFCVIDTAIVIPEKFSTNYRSAMAFGTMRIVHDENERINSLRKLGLRYYDNTEACEAEVARGIKRCEMLALDIEEVSGKQAADLV